MVEVLIIVDVSENPKAPALRIFELSLDADPNDWILEKQHAGNACFVREVSSDFVANKILENAIADEMCVGKTQRIYIVITSHVARNGQYADNVIRHFIKERRKKNDQFYFLSTNMMAIVKSLRQAFTAKMITNKRLRRGIYEALNSAAGIR